MNQKKTIKATLIFALFFLTLGGWCLHLRIHPPEKNVFNIIPFITGILSAFCLPLLFCFRRTLALAYILSGFVAILGTILMAHFSMVHFQGPLTLTNVFLGTTFPDIAILWGRFAISRSIFKLEFLRSETDVSAKGHFFRYPNMGWWWVHLFAVAFLYFLGNILFK